MVDVPCGSCRHCCTNELLMLHPECGDNPLQYKTMPVVNPLTGKPGLALQQKPNGDCIYLGETGCTIHGHAPALCKEFDCRRFYLRFMEMPRPERRRIEKRIYGTKAQVAIGKKMLTDHPL